MYASVRHYSVDPDRVDELMHRLDEKFAPRLEQMPGFVAYQAIDAGMDRVREGRVFTVTICSDRKAADLSAEITAKFVRGGQREPRHVRGARGRSRLASAGNRVT